MPLVAAYPRYPDDIEFSDHEEYAQVRDKELDRLIHLLKGDRKPNIYGYMALNGLHEAEDMAREHARAEVCDAFDRLPLIY